MACTAGERASVRVVASPAARKRLAVRRPALRVSLRLAAYGAATLQRSVLLR
jgi:hypothetical protein